MNGWCGRILSIDLTTGTGHIVTPYQQLYTHWIGGKGLAGHYLAPHITRDCADPAMPLIFMTGPLVDTASPTSGRMTIASRSPLTGTVGDTSVGGSLGTQIKRCGYDGIIITGKSAQLCGIEITDESWSICEATGLRGMTTDKVTEQFGDKGSVVCIGPAAENGVRFSSIIIDGHYAAGRNGLGLICAYKNLKYLTVSGSGKTAVADPQELARAREDIFRLVAASPILSGELGIGNFGTGALYDLMDTRSMMPTANFRSTRFEHAAHMNAFSYKEKYTTSRLGCRGCHILCKKKTGDGRAVPEFETMSHFSALVGNRDIETVVEANRLCNVYGMDTISAAGALACYGEIRCEEIGGARLLELLHAIGEAKGDGAALGQGSAAYAAQAGFPNASMSVKGLDMSAYDPRGAYGMGLAYATSTRGACHLRAYPIGHEILRKPVATDRFSFAGKARIIKISEDMNAVVDSLTACKFVFLSASLEEYARVYTAVTGVAATAQDLLKAGERIYYHDRVMNAANGFTAAEDDLPARFFTHAGSSDSQIAIPALDREEFLDARARYYEVRGLDSQGCPTREKKHELGISW